MSLFLNIKQVSNIEILEQHQFPLFEYTGLYQKFYSAEQALFAECIIVSLDEAKDKTDEELLNLVVASGYVADNADITFRIDNARQYLYTYFNFVPENPPQ